MTRNIEGRERTETEQRREKDDRPLSRLIALSKKGTVPFFEIESIKSERGDCPLFFD